MPPAFQVAFVLSPSIHLSCAPPAHPSHTHCLPLQAPHRSLIPLQQGHPVLLLVALANCRHHQTPLPSVPLPQDPSQTSSNAVLTVGLRPSTSDRQLTRSNGEVFIPMVNHAFDEVGGRARAPLVLHPRFASDFENGEQPDKVNQKFRVWADNTLLTTTVWSLYDFHSNLLPAYTRNLRLTASALDLGRRVGHHL